MLLQFLQSTSVKLLSVILVLLVFLIILQCFPCKIHQQSAYILLSALKLIVDLLLYMHGSCAVFDLIIEGSRSRFISSDPFFDPWIFGGSLDLINNSFCASLQQFFFFPEHHSLEPEETAFIVDLNLLFLLGQQSRFCQPTVAHLW